MLCSELGTLEDLQKACKGGINPVGNRTQPVNMLASDLLWSDPVSEAGMQENAVRGVGLVFGPDKTEEFLRTNGVRLFVRSHEGPDARYNAENGMDQMDTGYTLDHDTPAGAVHAALLRIMHALQCYSGSCCRIQRSWRALCDARMS